MNITEDDHARHTTPKGVLNPSDLVGDMRMTKMAKDAMKFIHKRHITTKGKLGSPKMKRRKS